MAMYAYNDNGTLRMMASLPSRLRLPDGLTRTSLDELTTAQLTELSIYPATEVKPEYDPAMQVLGEPVLKLSKGKVTATYPVADKSKEQIAAEVEAAKAAKLAELAQKRWEAVQAGVEINGVTVATDSDSQTALIGAAFGAFVKMIGSSLPAAAKPLVKLIPEESGWKGKGGKWADLSITDTLNVAVTVRAHVQSLFDKERGLAEKIAACSTVAEVEAITW
jgi:hypothetical protein